ncbi:sigma D regulator [Celerinatantimonas sp. YJH-8]|uniref:sigma D regulator n=1 Tax=Celerinatantimonas sp. YJH-8 TaxID=3228714 RepID=UPI0038BEDBB1
MLTRVTQAQELWGGADKNIDAWLNARKRLLVEYCQLVGHKKQYKPSAPLPDIEAIGHFCNHLVDYVSTGHFGIFDQIIENCQDYQRVHHCISRLSPTTDDILDFYDQFSALDEQVSLDHFDRALGKLGETLEARFNIEDKLLKALYQHSIDEPLVAI